MSYFKEMTPESQGMHSSAIIHFLDEVDRKGLELHRFQVIRHGYSIAKGSFKPYTEEDLHPVYSFTKSLTSTAIGFAVQEGLLSLDEHLVDFFPEEVPDPKELLCSDGSVPVAHYKNGAQATTLDEMMQNLKDITIHHLLCMSCGHEDEIPDRSATWIHSFFRQPVLYKPGTFFKYNTAGSNMLAAILKKRTGEHLTDFLKKRLFEPLEMGDIFCYHLSDPMEVQAGGHGMKLSLENMAKFTYFMLHDGYWEGKPILPGWYSLMSQKHMETAGDSEGHIKDWAMGYGYQCWRGVIPGSFRADGAFGQFGLVFPEQDMIIILNSATEQTQILLDIVNEVLVSGVNSRELLADEEINPNLTKAINSMRDAKAGKNQSILASKVESLALPALKNCHNPVFEAKLENRIYRACGPCSGLKTLIGGAGILPFDDDSQITAMSFLFGEEYVIWLVEEKEKSEDGKVEEAAHMLHVSLENTFYRGYCKATESEYAATARWRSLICLEMEVRRMDALSGTRMLFRFEGDKMRIFMDETLMTDGGLGMTERHVSEFVK